MMTEAVKGRAIAEAEQLQQRFRAVLTGQLDPESAALGKLESLAGVRHYPARIKCALLGWHALMHALADVEAPADAPVRPQGRTSPDRPSARVGQSGKAALA
jgi:nitrogen fixation NifU-like protein